MAALHSALQTLSPTSFSSVPLEQAQLATYLQEAFAKSQLLIDSVPPPPEVPLPIPTSRPRANTASSTGSNVSEISASSARPDPPHPSHAQLQKEWGKPLKMAAKDNPMGMAVYKLGGKDGRGAWFARRSVHEGMSFAKWKLGLQREFPESLAVQGGPGEGNIRGIGGERRVERKAVEGVGSMEVYHLSAQFPGPTTPRDFVTLLMTSSSAISDDPSSQLSPSDTEGRSKALRDGSTAKHFLVISRPCQHPDCPPRDGFIRGEYESIEFIREIPPKPKKSSSTTDLSDSARHDVTSTALEKEAILRNARQNSNPLGTIHQGGSDSNLAERTLQDSDLAQDVAEIKAAPEGRARGRTISYAESRGSKAKGEAVDTPQEDSEMNPVEWIMITRSDPGGSVPRFLVERGTPAGIVSDASKFMEWARKKEHTATDEEENLDEKDSELADGAQMNPLQTNGYVTGLEETKEVPDSTEDGIQQGLLSSVVNAAYAGVEAYAPQAIIDHLPGHQPSTPSKLSSNVTLPDGTKDLSETSSIASTTSVASFASADSHFSEAQSTSSITASLQAKDAKSLSPHEKELVKLASRKRKLDASLQKTLEKERKDKADMSTREEQRLKRAEEKHAREVAKVEAKHAREVKKIEDRRARDAAREEERRKKAEDRDEKARLGREKDELKAQLDFVTKERDILRGQVGDLQKENTALVARIGRFDSSVARELLEEVRSETMGRSRSSSLKRAKGNQGDSAALASAAAGTGVGAAGVDATVLGAVLGSAAGNLDRDKENLNGNGNAKPGLLLRGKSAFH